MSKNNISRLNTKKIKTKNIERRSFSLKKWRGLFLGLIKSPCPGRRLGNTGENNPSQSSMAKEITPWDDDESGSILNV